MNRFLSKIDIFDFAGRKRVRDAKLKYEKTMFEIHFKEHVKIKSDECPICRRLGWLDEGF